MHHPMLFQYYTHPYSILFKTEIGPQVGTSVMKIEALFYARA